MAQIDRSTYLHFVFPIISIIIIIIIIIIVTSSHRSDRKYVVISRKRCEIDI